MNEEVLRNAWNILAEIRNKMLAIYPSGCKVYMRGYNAKYYKSLTEEGPGQVTFWSLVSSMSASLANLEFLFEHTSEFNNAWELFIQEFGSELNFVCMVLGPAHSSLELYSHDPSVPGYSVVF